jgi:ferredoxin-NADP reductase
MAFTAELAAYGDRVTLCPQDRHGLLNLDRLLGTPRADTLVYACGPEPLLAAVEQRMTGWPAGAQHVLDGLRLAGVRGRLVLGL